MFNRRKASKNHHFCAQNRRFFIARRARAAPVFPTQALESMAVSRETIPRFATPGLEKFFRSFCRSLAGSELARQPPRGACPAVKTAERKP
jgi:hypothetical protein